MSATIPMMSQMGMIPIEDERIEVATVQPIRFWIKYKGMDGPNAYSEEWVEWAKKGVSIPTTCVDAIKRVKKDRSLWTAIEPFYQNWQRGGGSEVIQGTPLSTWAGVTIDVVEALRTFNIRSVEDLSVMTDSIMNKIPNPNMPLYRERAKKFLATKDIAEAVTELTNSKQELENLKAEIEAMRKAMADANRRDDDDDTRPRPRRRQAVAAE